MDKIATNNFIVELRTDVKAAKAMVAGNLVRKINELKKALEKDTDDSAKKEKAEKKIETLHADIKLLKTIDHYVICKNAILKPDPKHWSDILCNSKAPEETKLIARVVSKGRIQKKVAKFRSDHKDCDEWLEEYFEFREKKRQLTEVKVAKRKTKPTGHRNRPPRELTDKTNDLETDSNPVETKKQFAKKWNKNPGKNHNRDANRKGPARNHDKGQPRTGNRDHQAGNPNRDQSRNRNSTRGRDNARTFNSSYSSDKDKPKNESLHPSWASKRREKEILKAALSGKAPEQPKRIILNSA